VAPVVFIYALIMILSHTQNSLYVRNENIESRSVFCLFVCLLVLVLLTVKHLDLWLTLSCLMRSGRRDRDRMVVGCNTTYAKGLSPLMLRARILLRRGVQHCVIKFFSDMRQVGGFLRVLRFPPPIKLKYC
jgi:hypothetical protein